MISKHIAALWVASALAVGCAGDDGSPDGNSSRNSANSANASNNVNNANAQNSTNNANAMNNANNVDPDMGVENCRISGCEEGLVCNTSTGVCAPCSFSEECGDNAICDVDGACVCEAGFHSCNGTCVPSTTVETCGARCEPCPTIGGATTTCEAGQCGAVCPGDQVLNDDGDACVGCSANADCQDPFASKCSQGTNECVRCMETADCAHLASTPVCETDNRRCVECVDDSVCGGNSCDRALGECTQTPVGSAQNCEACLADSECTNGFYCVPMFYQGQVRSSGFCLEQKVDSCATPRFNTEITRASVDGVSGTFCGVNEGLTSCEAVLAYGTKQGLCAQDTDCPGPGAVCEPIDFGSAACTYRCDFDAAECDDENFVFCATGFSGFRICGGY